MIGRERELLTDAREVDEERIGDHRAFQGIDRIDAEGGVGAEGEGAGAAFRRQFRDAAIPLGRIGSLVAVEQPRLVRLPDREKIGPKVEGKLSGDGRAERAFRGEGSGGERLGVLTAHSQGGQQVQDALREGAPVHECSMSSGLLLRRTNCVAATRVVGQVYRGWGRAGRGGNPCPIPGRPNPTAERKRNLPREGRV